LWKVAQLRQLAEKMLERGTDLIFRLSLGGRVAQLGLSLAPNAATAASMVSFILDQSTVGPWCQTSPVSVGE
jgi:hypothetical protein